MKYLLLLLALPLAAQNYASYNNQPVARMSFLRHQVFTPHGNVLGDSSLSGWWQLSEGGGPVAIDGAGAAVSGAWKGTRAGAFGYYAQGKSGAFSASFDGSTDSITVPNSGSRFAPSAGFTFVSWVNPRSYPASGNFAEPLRLNGGNGASGFFISDRGDVAGFQPAIENSSGTTFGGVIPNASVPVNKWSQIACVFDGSVVVVYLNGAAQGSPATFTGSLGSNSTAVFIGAFNSTPTRPFSGSIANLRIYKRALSASEILVIYNAENH